VMTPEFSRPIRIDTLGTAPRRIEIAAEEAERAALALRFGLVSLDSLAAEAEVSRNGAAVVARGTLRGAVVQSCVATGEPVPGSIEDAFRIEFRPHPDEVAPDEEVELGEDELDIVFYEGGAIDLGEAVAESLSLALDPYPRAPAAEAALREVGVKSEEEAKAEASPFAVLRGLKDNLG
jgi:uncharacterized metal-binding protein YceD (DUF177 family)